MAEPAKIYNNALTNVNNTFMPLIERQLEGNGIRMDDYSKQCVINAISGIHSLLDSKGIAWSDQNLDRTNITQILLTIASLKLNAAASPREVYFTLRNVKTAAKDETGKDIWKKQIEMGIEGDGNDTILARFGRDVKKIGQFWLVRENDEFEYPAYNGLEVTPPKWKPTGKGKVIRVVYPIIKKDDTVEYYIAEREDVTRNLVAHINNNLMNETFGIAKSRFDATPDQKKKIEVKKTELLKKASEKGLDALDDPELLPYISPAWSEFQSREAMIIRKMRNNIVKKIPKDFGNAYLELTYAQASDDAIVHAERRISEHANKEVIDVEFTDLPNDPPPASGDQNEETHTNTPAPDKKDRSENKKAESAQAASNSQPEQVTLDEAAPATTRRKDRGF
jgi:hypothetical protein